MKIFFYFTLLVQASKLVSAQTSCSSEEVSLPFVSESSLPSSSYTSFKSWQQCDDGASSWNAADLGDGQWHTYTPSRDVVLTFQIEEGPGAGSYTGRIPSVQVFSGSCSQLACVAFRNLPLDESFVAEGGVTYFFWIHCSRQFEGCALTGDFIFRLYANPIPENDKIENALPISPPVLLEGFNKAGALSDFYLDKCGLTGLVYGVFFQYTPTAPEVLSLSVSYKDNTIPAIDMGKPNVGIMYVQEDGTLNCLDRTAFDIEFPVQAGVSYYILVASPVPGDFKTFDLSLRVS